MYGIYEKVRIAVGAHGTKLAAHGVVYQGGNEFLLLEQLQRPAIVNEPGRVAATIDARRDGGELVGGVQRIKNRLHTQIGRRVAFRQNQQVQRFGHAGRVFFPNRAEDCRVVQVRSRVVRIIVGVPRDDPKCRQTQSWLKRFQTQPRDFAGYAGGAATCGPHAQKMLDHKTVLTLRLCGQNVSSLSQA